MEGGIVIELTLQLYESEQETEISIALYFFSNKGKLSSKGLQIYQNLMITNAKRLLDPCLRQNKVIGPICPYHPKAWIKCFKAQRKQNQLGTEMKQSCGENVP